MNAMIKIDMSGNKLDNFSSAVTIDNGHKTLNIISDTMDINLQFSSLDDIDNYIKALVLAKIKLQKSVCVYPYIRDILAEIAKG